MSSDPGIDRRWAIVGGAAAILAAVSPAASARPAVAINAEADEALQKLFAKSDKARQLSNRALGTLIFPKIAKAGFMVGGQGGDGVMRVHGVSAAYYQIVAASFGFQAGVQTFSLALFLITQSAMRYLDESDGWALGSGPSLVIADQGIAKTLNTTTLTQDVYAVPFGLRGLMAGLGIEGSKITRIVPDEPVSPGARG